jgi:3-hydroxyacyl-[acyl-carrier-protein] dehydratase
MHMQQAQPFTATPTGSSLEGAAIRSMMPHRGRMMLLDRIEAFSLADLSVVALKNVSQSDPLLEGHFRDAPIFPPALVIEAMAQSAGFLMNIEWMLHREGGDLESFLRRQREGAIVRRPPITVLAESRVRHLRLVHPGSQIVLEAAQRLRRAEMASFRVRALVEGQEVAKGEMLLAFPPYAQQEEKGPRAGGRGMAKGGRT